MTDQISTGALAYLAARGLDPELAVRLGLRSEKAAGGGDILIFPFVQNGQVVNHKYRVLPKVKMWQDKDAVKCAWNEDALRDDSLLTEPVIITEGEFDAVAAIQAGFQRTVSIPDGAPTPGERDAEDLKGAAKYEWLRALRPLLGKDRAPVVIIAADGDAAGGALLQDLSLQLGRVRCKYLTYPKAKNPEARGRTHLKDLNEVLEDYGVRGVQATIGKARFLKVDGVFKMSELPPLPPSDVFDIGFDLLGQNFKVRRGDLSVVTGIPSYGKSTLVNDLWCRAAKAHGLKIAWASFEQEPQRDHRRNLRSWFCGAAEWTLTERDMAAADAWIDQFHRFIVPSEDDDVTLEWLLEKAEAAAVQDGCDVLVIDPWNEMDHDRDRHLSLTEYVNRSIKTCRRFARAFKIHLMIVAHPTKAVKGEGGAYRCPTMYDISDSSAWYNKADLGMIVHRPNPDETQVVVEKSRYHEILGVPGQVFMHFSRDTRRFEEIGRDSLVASIG
jgi:twinkle protein